MGGIFRPNSLMIFYQLTIWYIETVILYLFELKIKKLVLALSAKSNGLMLIVDIVCIF